MSHCAPPGALLALRHEPSMLGRSRANFNALTGQPSRAENRAVATILCVLYDDPVDGYPTSYARDDVPRIESYYGGQSTPSPERIDFTPGELLGSVSGGLGLRAFLEEAGHRFVVTSDKDGEGSEFERELLDADVVISQPFWPAYL